jgi:NitT/TauT family transport system substrate-binding protein
MRLLRFLLAGACAAVIGAPAAEAADPVLIRVSYVVAPSDWAPLLPEKPDLLRNNGKSYKLEVVRVVGTPALVTAMANNEIEIGNHAYSSLAIAIANAGMTDLRVISDQFQDGVPGHSTTQFYVLKDSPIQKVEDVKGKVVSSNAAGSAVDIAMRAMLKKHGLEDKRDYTHIEAPLPAMKAMLLDKKADLIPSVVPFQFDPELQSKGRPLFTQREALGVTQMIVWTARQGFIDKNRAAMVDFMEDALRVVRWYLDPKNHDEAVKIAAKITRLPPERFQGWFFTNKDYARNGNLMPDIAALQSNIDQTRALGFFRNPVDVQKYVDLSLVQEAAARLK